MEVKLNMLLTAIKIHVKMFQCSVLRNVFMYATKLINSIYEYVCLALYACMYIYEECSKKD